MNYYARLRTFCGCERFIRLAGSPYRGKFSSITIPGWDHPDRVFELDLDAEEPESHGDNVVFFAFRETETVRAR